MFFSFRNSPTPIAFQQLHPTVFWRMFGYPVMSNSIASKNDYHVMPSPS